MTRDLIAAILGLSLASCPACRNEAIPSTPGGASEPSVPSGRAPKQAPPRTPESRPTEAPAPLSLEERELFFAAGLGREAILARERREHARAKALLDRLLGESELSDDERGAAELLRALEDLRDDRHARAAERLRRARRAPALQVIEVRLRGLEAQAWLDAGRPDLALEAVSAIDERARRGSVFDDDLLLIEADARLRSNDRQAAIDGYRRYLERHPAGNRRLETRLKLARVLAGGDDPEGKKEAIEAYEKIAIVSPLSDWGQEAMRMIPKLRRELGLRRGATERGVFERKVALARLEDLLARREYGRARREAELLLRRRASLADVRCRALYSKGSAIFRQRERARARPVFERAAKACREAGPGLADFEVRSRYQMGRGLYAEGKYAPAAAAFEQLARDYPDHSYADDAWVLSGESWTEHGDERAAAVAFRHALAGIANGDKRDEARRRLLLLAFARHDYQEVLKLTDEALAIERLRPGQRAKLLYYRGRALARIGKLDEARTAWLEALETEPLGYFALQALSRLRDLGEDAMADGVELLTQGGTGDASGLRLPAKTAAAKALLLARLGLGREAREELEHARVEGWPAVAVLNQAGLWGEAQRLIGGMGSRWRTQPPVGVAKLRWELAHPRPFERLVVENEAAYAVPTNLVFAVMQTESRFEPGATSWAGARGLTQLMPATARGLAEEAGVELDDRAIYQPSLNLSLGARYLGKLVARFGGGDVGVALAVPSYNAGAGSVGKWLDRQGHLDLDLFLEAIPYDETRRYAQRVLGRWFVYRWLYLGRDAIPYLPLRSARALAG